MIGMSFKPIALLIEGKEMNVMKRIALLISVTGLVGLLFVPLGVAADKNVYKIKWAHVLAPSEPTHIVALKTAERIRERTGGGVDVEVYPSSQLGKQIDVFQQIKLGAPIIAHIEPSWAADLGPYDLGAVQGPFLIKDYDEYKKLVNSEFVAQQNQKILDTAGLRIITWNWYFGPRHIISDRGFKSPEDLKGLKIRCPSSPTWVETFKVLGASPVTIPWGEVYTGLSQGVVEAAEAPLSTLYGSKLYEVKKVITRTGHFKAITGQVINEKFFKSMPEDYQRIISEEIIRGGEEMSAMTVDGQQEFVDKLKAQGVSFVEPDLDAYQAAAKGFYSQELHPKWSPDMWQKLQQAIHY